MTNNQNNTEEKCPKCSAYEYFLNLVDKTPATAQEAFHNAAEYLIENVIEDLAEIIGEKEFDNGYDIGFAEGFQHAHEVIAGNLTKTAEKLAEINECDECCCDCEDGCKNE